MPFYRQGSVILRYTLRCLRFSCSLKNSWLIISAVDFVNDILSFMINFHPYYIQERPVTSIIIINIIVIVVIIYYCYRIILISYPHYLCVVWLVSVTQPKKVGTVGCTLWLALSTQIKILFFFCDNNIILTPPTPPPPPLHTEIVVQFYPWSKFSFLLFQTHYHTLPYPKTYLPWQQLTSVVDSGDSLFLTSPLSPTVNSPNNPTTGRRNKSSKQDPNVALCCSIVFI